MEKPDGFTADVNGKQTTFLHLGNQFVPSFREVTSVAAVPFNDDGKIVIVNTTKRGWDLPGGHVEPYEKDPIETLNRELMEEARAIVTQPVLVEVIESDFFDDQKSYMLIYAVRIRSLLDFEVTDEIRERAVVDIQDFIAHYQAGDKRLMEKTVLRAKSLLA